MLAILFLPRLPLLTEVERGQDQSLPPLYRSAEEHSRIMRRARTFASNHRPDRIDILHPDATIGPALGGTRLMIKKRAVVTGASSGIGRETAIQLAEAGWMVLAVARREARLQALADEFPKQIFPFAADICDAGVPE
jgi:hypothetical protein